MLKISYSAIFSQYKRFFLLTSVQYCFFSPKFAFQNYIICS